MEHFKNPKLAHFKALQMYLDLVREIPEVIEVRLAEHDELHTIISATPHDNEPRYRVIKAQGKVMQGVELQPFLFLLLNRDELPEMGREESVSNIGEIVWQR